VATGEIARPLAARRLAWTRYARDALAAAAMAAMVVAGFLLAAAAASGPNQFVFGSEFILPGYPDWLAGPLAGLYETLEQDGFIAALLVLYALYLVVVALADHVRLSWAVATIGALHLIFLLAPPLHLTDVFNYLGFARLGALHGLDPYTHMQASVPEDSVVRYITWPDLTSPYGPLFTLGSYALVPFGVPAGVWIFKVTSALASLGCVALVGVLAQERGRPVVPAVLLMGLNPLLLVYGVGGAHNDMYMLLLLLGGVLLALHGREALGAGAVVAAAAVKFTAGLALPFMWLAARGRRRKLLLGGGVAALAVVAAVALAFSDGIGSALVPVSEQRDATSLRTLPGQVAQAFLDERDVPQVVQTVAAWAFVAVVLGLLFLAWRGKDWIECIGWTMLALLLTLTWVMPWYIVWVLPFAAVAPGSRLRWAALIFGAFLVVVRMPYPPIA
jgi:hypothetical protein